MSEKAEFITPPNSLRSKVGEVDTKAPGGGIDLAALERAEAVINGLKSSYIDWVQEDLNNLGALVEKLVAAREPRERKKLCDDIFKIAHDVKGQGGSFDYHLITTVGNQLCRFLEKMTVVTDAHVEAIRLHVDGMKLIIQRRMSGQGGKTGEMLLDGLYAVIEKLSKA